jgi:hypothetical protein
MSLSERREALILHAAAHLRGGPWAPPAWVGEPAGVVALRWCLPEVLTALVLRRTPLDAGLTALVLAGVEDTGVLPLPPRRVAADEYVTVQLLELLGAGGLLETDVVTAPVLAAAPDWEELGEELADLAACTAAPLPGLGTTVVAGRAVDVARAACLAAARFDPRRSARILRWLPSSAPAAREQDTMSHLMSYLTCGWPDDGDVVFTAALAGTG